MQLVSCLYLYWSSCGSILKKSFQKSPLQRWQNVCIFEILKKLPHFDWLQLLNHLVNFRSQGTSRKMKSISFIWCLLEYCLTSGLSTIQPQSYMTEVEVTARYEILPYLESSLVQETDLVTGHFSPSFKICTTLNPYLRLGS